MNAEIIIKRLAIIKYLFSEGVEQSKQSEIIAFSSVLTFHDCIDMFMQLAGEKKGIEKKERERLYMMNFFTKIPELTLGSSVDKINTRRNNLKHHGQIIAQIEIDECRTIATLFLEENTKQIFELDFNQISIIDLVENELLRQLLNKAIFFKTKEEIKESIIEMSKAFYQLTHIDTEFLRDKKQFSYIDIYNIPYL